MYEKYLAILSLTKEPGWFSQYNDYNIGWTALILIFLNAKITFFLLEHPALCWGSSRSPVS
jgi:hypothetical protein